MEPNPMAQQSFRSPLTGLPYITLSDLFPDLPASHKELQKLLAEARDEIYQYENKMPSMMDIAFVALLNRQIQVMEKAKKMFLTDRFRAVFRGNPMHGARYLNEFEIVVDDPPEKQS